MGAKSYVKYIVPGAAGGSVLKSVALPVVVLVGGYIVVSKVTGFNPLGDALSGASQAIGNTLGSISQPIGDAWNNFWGTVLPPPTVPHMAFSKDSGYVGDRIGLAVDALKPSTPLLYGWKELNFSQQHMSQADGQWFFEFDIVSSTQPGTYTVFVDQRNWGGPRYEKKFTVLASDQPPPPVPVVNYINMTASRTNLSLGDTVTFTTKIYDLTISSQPLAKSGEPIGLFLNTQGQFAQGSTDSTGKWVKSVSTSLFGRGTHSILAVYMKSPAGEPPIQDQVYITVT